MICQRVLSMGSTELENRKLILPQFFEKPGASGSSIAKKLKMAKSTVNGVLKRYNETLSIE